MNYTLIIRPLIGAGIGYVTNWIAVKMMFRPLHSLKIGKVILPFTPGIIPKNKDRIAKSIGNAISKDLLTEDTIVEALLSDDIKNKLKENIDNHTNSQLNSSQTFEDLVLSYIDKDNYDKIRKNIETKLTELIFENIKNADLGNLIANQIENFAKDEMKKSLLGIFGGGSILSTISNAASTKIDEYINENGKDLIAKMISEELEKYSSKQISEIVAGVRDSNVDFSSMMMKAYEKIISQKISDFLKALNISKIVSDKIEKMDVLEVEKIILEIMKKELNALVNLGAIIGFLLGLLNLFF